MKKYLKKAIVVLMTVIVLCFLSSCSSTDFIATVKAHKPLTSQSLPYTYEEVLDKYLISPKWTENVSGDSAVVTVSGEVKGDTDNLGDMVIKIDVTPIPGDDSSVKISLKSLSYGGNQSSSAGEAGDLLAALFLAYDYGYDSFVDFVTANY